MLYINSHTTRFLMCQLHLFKCTICVARHASSIGYWQLTLAKKHFDALYSSLIGGKREVLYRAWQGVQGNGRQYSNPTYRMGIPGVSYREANLKESEQIQTLNDVFGLLPQTYNPLIKSSVTPVSCHVIQALASSLHSSHSPSHSLCWVILLTDGDCCIVCQNVWLN